MSTIYIKHNLFHESKLGRDVELQNTHILLLNYPRDMMQVRTLSAQSGLGSEPVGWYRDATSVLYGHLLIDLSPRTDDRLHYCTNTGCISSEFYIADRLRQSKIWDNEHIKSLLSKCSNHFLAIEKVFPSGLSKRVYPAYFRIHFSFSQVKHAKHKNPSPDKFSKLNMTVFS